MIYGGKYRINANILANVPFTPFRFSVLSYLHSDHSPNAKLNSLFIALVIS